MVEVRIVLILNLSSVRIEDVSCTARLYKPKSSCERQNAFRLRIFREGGMELHVEIAILIDS